MRERRGLENELSDLGLDLSRRRPESDHIAEGEVNRSCQKNKLLAKSPSTLRRHDYPGRPFETPCLIFSLCSAGGRMPHRGIDVGFAGLDTGEPVLAMERAK